MFPSRTLPSPCIQAARMPASAALKSLRVFDVDYGYLDSGPPTSSNYTTWVFVHGLGFNGGLLDRFESPLVILIGLRISTTPFALRTSCLRETPPPRARAQSPHRQHLQTRIPSIQWLSKRRASRNRFWREDRGGGTLFPYAGG